jgi:hypothetical protein
MPGSAAPQAAAHRRGGGSAEPHLVPLAGEWALWRDLAVRSAGFPVSGLDIFGSPDEQAGLRSVASPTEIKLHQRATARRGRPAAPGLRRRT